MLLKKEQPNTTDKKPRKFEPIKYIWLLVLGSITSRFSVERHFRFREMDFRYFHLWREMKTYVEIKGGMVKDL